MMNQEHIFEKDTLFRDPITQIEEYIESMKRKGDNSIASFRTTISKFFPNEKLEHPDAPVTIYAVRDNFESLYFKTRQKTINLLMEVK